MRNIKFLGFFLTAMLMVFSMSSCLNSADDNSSKITPEQKKQCYLTVAGPHSGKLIYITLKNSNGNTITDSIPASWNVTSDSTMVLNNISSKAVASMIDSTTTEHKEIRQAIAAQSPKSMNCYIGFVNTNPIQWLVNPVGLTYNVTYGGKAHEIKIVFYTNNTYSFGQYSSTTKLQNLQLLAYGAYIDGTLDSDATRLVVQGAPIWFSER